MFYNKSCIANPSVITKISLLPSFGTVPVGKPSVWNSFNLVKTKHLLIFLWETIQSCFSEKSYAYAQKTSSENPHHSNSQTASDDLCPRMGTSMVPNRYPICPASTTKLLPLLRQTTLLSTTATSWISTTLLLPTVLQLLPSTTIVQETREQQTNKLLIDERREISTNQLAEHFIYLFIFSVAHVKISF